MTQEQSVWFDNSKFYAHFTLDNILFLRDNDTQEEFRFSPQGAYELLEFLYQNRESLYLASHGDIPGTRPAWIVQKEESALFQEEE